MLFITVQAQGGGRSGGAGGNATTPVQDLARAFRNREGGRGTGTASITRNPQGGRGTGGIRRRPAGRRARGTSEQLEFDI